MGRSGWVFVGALIALLAYLVGSEVYYARSIQPRGIASVRNFRDRFDSPAAAYEFRRSDGQVYRHFYGAGPPPFCLALPSSAPCYVFDADGSWSSGAPIPVITPRSSDDGQ